MDTPLDETGISELCSQAEEKFSAGRINRARCLYKKALEHGEQMMPMDVLVNVLETLAVCCWRLKWYQDAIKYNRATLDVLEASSAYGPDHQDTIRIRYNLARALVAASTSGRKSTSKLKEAKSLYNQVLETVSANGDVEMVRQARQSLASVLLKLSRYSEARKLYEELIHEKVARSRRGKDPERLRLEHDYASALYHSKDYEESKKLFSQIEDAISSMSEVPRRELAVLSQSVGRYLAACVEVTKDLDMGSARSVAAARRRGDSLSQPAKLTKSIGRPSLSHPAHIVAKSVANEKNDNLKPLSDKTAASKVSSRGNARTSTSRSRSNDKRADASPDDEPPPKTSSAPKESSSSTSNLTAPATHPKARRSRSDQSLGQPSKLDSLATPVVRPRSAQSSLASASPPKSYANTKSVAPPSARRTKSDDASSRTKREGAEENLTPSSSNDSTRKAKGAEDEATPSSSKHSTRRAKGVEDNILSSGSKDRTRKTENVEDVTTLSSSKDSLRKAKDTSIKAGPKPNSKPRKDQSPASSKDTKIPELNISIPGPWPEEAPPSVNHTRGTKAPSSSKSYSSTSALGKSRSVPRPNSKFKHIPRKIRTTQATGKFYSLPKNANDTDDWFHRLRTHAHTLLCHGKPKNPSRKLVRVAIIDSGFADVRDDTALPISRQVLQKIKHRPITYKDFTGGDASHVDNRKDLHGTWCASILMQTAPNAELYVANVVRPNKKGQQSKHVADAITWAMENEVDIISMSFGWETEMQNVDEQIDLARQKGILFFAAASNDGDRAQDHGKYPASKQTVYCVYSCDGAGRTSKFSPLPPKGDLGLMFPGEGLTILEADHKPVEGVQTDTEAGVIRKDGTSYATPIAAGTAAMVLDLARQELENSKEVERRLKKVEGMSEVFLAMCRDDVRDGGYRHVKPWTILGEHGPIDSPNVNESHKWHALMDVLACLRKFGPFPGPLS
jgi:tetratricopeptide (TPR) repeat protein